MNILIIGPSWVGDMVMAQSLFKVLVRLYPNAQIDVLAPGWSRPILEAMPEVRDAIDMPVDHGKLMLKARRELAVSLKAKDYAWSIVLPNSLKSALIPWFSSIPRRTGWRGEMRYGLLNDIRKLDKEQLPLMVERFVALAYDNGEADLSRIPNPELKPNAQLTADVCAKYAVDADGAPVLGLCPGAEFGAAKQWPAEHYAAVARHYLQKGWRVWLFGSTNDKPVCEEIATASGSVGVMNFAGLTTLQEAVALLSLTSRVVSNDSGLMHVAAALGSPLVAVYGSTSPDFTPPLTEHKQIVRLGLDCSPCFERTCPLGHYNCLKQLPAQQVISALDKLPCGSDSQGVAPIA
ncbi:lipopolysaccharide heptosyltransferase II [Hahella sp. CR1]|uniref:lipopolysaccharide heptosyltransferase II n=1 Tax=Hahella sp. CR1 TaxID=2992807 RepID=UPI002442509A|nr:lipopolysaccharide heptosyltransferase II [Hahella sp. CR1]MDG9669167.1 lipopolysaccharide heptosyltransferase II [Hahella sp. CR1]